MNKNAVMGVVRHVLTTAGGILITRGVVDSTELEWIVGGVVTVGGIVWSIIDKRRA